MVIYARLTTNIRDVVRDPVDKDHRIIYSDNRVQLKDCFPGSHSLNLSTGELSLGNIQYPERPVVGAVAGYHQFVENKFHLETAPTKGEFYLLPTLFELERLAKEPIIIGGILSLNADGVREMEVGSDYFQGQKNALEEFTVAYARAAGNSPLQKPVLEGFYATIKHTNTWQLERANEPERSEPMRAALRRAAFQEQDFISTFGAHLYQQLKDYFGAPRFL